MINHNFDFDPEYGYSLEQLHRIKAPNTEPIDFDEFWINLYNKAISTPLKIERRPSNLSTANWVVEQIYFNTLNNFRIGSWLVTPTNNKVNKLQIAGHGYGGRECPDIKHELSIDTAHLFPLAPGFNISSHESIPYNNAREHVIYGMLDKHTYIFQECAASLWSAATLLTELYPGQASTLHYKGMSYGGGIGAIMLPWDQRYKSAELALPSFGHHPLRLKCRCVGSGEAVRIFCSNNPEVEHKVLPYFDAATHATRITQPTMFVCAAFDPAVPPPGQYAIANSCGSKKVIFDQKVGHCDFDYQEKQDEAIQRKKLRNDFFSNL